MLVKALYAIAIIVVWEDSIMFFKVVKNNRGRPNTSFISIAESYREDGKIKHRTIRNLGLFDDEPVPYIKAAFAKKKPRLVYDDE